MMQINATLALFGGPRAVTIDPRDTFTWPIVTEADEAAVLDVLRHGAMSDLDVTMEFEAAFAAWQDRRYALGFNTGTSALHAAMFAVKVGVGDEIICPSLTYWASALQVFALGGTVVFADISPDTLCIDPGDIAHRITDRTKAIMVVHYMGHPADMDAIMAIANDYGIPVIEDVSHAHGGLYRGQTVGTFGRVAAMSLMSGKSLPIGEGGMLVTDDQEVYERAIAFGHYRRYDDRIETPDLRPYRGLPMGGQKCRMNQLCSAMGRVQLANYDARAAETRRAINAFWDLLEDVPGLRAHRVDPDGAPEAVGAPDAVGDSTMAGWYAAGGLYRPEELGGLSVTRFAQAVQAEGSSCRPGINKPLHLHPLFNDCDIYGHGKPTRIANSDRDLRQPLGSLPVSEGIGARAFGIPQFKRYNPDVIEAHAMAYRKVAQHHDALLEGDEGNPPDLCNWGL